MKARHAAALTLVGFWYLMLPPLAANDPKASDATRPLVEWSLGAPYQTQSRCEAARTKLRNIVEDPQKRQIYFPAGSRHAMLFRYDRLMSSICVAADDPRLKSN